MTSSISTQPCLVDQILPPVVSITSGRSLSRDNTSLKRLLSNAPSSISPANPTTPLERQSAGSTHAPPPKEIEKEQEEVEVTAKHNPSDQPHLELPSNESNYASFQIPAQLPAQLPCPLLGHFGRWRQESLQGRLLPGYISKIPKDQLAILNSDNAWRPAIVGQPNLPGDVPPSLLQRLSLKAEGQPDKVEPHPFILNSSSSSPKQASEIQPPARPALPEHPDDDSDESVVAWSSSPPTQDRRNRLANHAASEDRDDELSDTDSEDALGHLPPDSSPPQLPAFTKTKTTFLPKPGSQLPSKPKDMSEREKGTASDEEEKTQNINVTIDPCANTSPDSKNLTQPEHPKPDEATEHGQSCKTPPQELRVAGPRDEMPQPTVTVTIEQDVRMEGTNPHLVGGAIQKVQVKQTPRPGREGSVDQESTQHVDQPGRHLNHPGDEPVSTACVPGTFDENTTLGEVVRSRPYPSNDSASSGLSRGVQSQHQGSTQRHEFAQDIASPKARSEAYGPSALHAGNPLASSDQETESMQIWTPVPNLEMSEDQEIGSSPPDHDILPDSSSGPSNDRHGMSRLQSYLYALPQTIEQKNRSHEFGRKRASDEKDVPSINKHPRTAQTLPSSSILDPDLAVIAQEARVQRREYLTKWKKPANRRQDSLTARVDNSASRAASDPLAGTISRARMPSQSLPGARTSILQTDGGDEEGQAVVRTHRTDVVAPQASQQLTSTYEGQLFSEYQAAYPEYAGSLSHFQQAMRLLRRTSLSGKGFHPFLFDDAIFHHYHTYRAYKADEVDDCENAMSFHEFYNQRIINPSHVLGLITLEALRWEESQAPVPRPRKRQLSVDTSEDDMPRELEYGMDGSWSDSQGGPTSDRGGTSTAQSQVMTQTPRAQVFRRRLGDESPDLGTPIPRQKLQSSVPQSHLQAARVISGEGVERGRVGRRSDPLPASKIQAPESVRKHVKKTPRTMPKTFTMTAATLSSPVPRAAPFNSRMHSEAHLESQLAQSHSPTQTKARPMQHWWQEADTPFKRFERQMSSLPGECGAFMKARSDAIDQGINIFTWRI
ncbi:hypothetical protein B0A52_08770 [Exophiala mesophila]|uniref:Uncharacterized protein n=1 Tax=Exophiala mesophila TaxID=212818 RepID=A0A438MUJ8_EXOME|nr:hypothetical protein B0A52_08770 [Exophiala mesophila]